MSVDAKSKPLLFEEAALHDPELLVSLTDPIHTQAGDGRNARDQKPKLKRMVQQKNFMRLLERDELKPLP